MTSTSPAVSVVIASIVGPPFIDGCLRSLERQAAEANAEVIVVASGSAEYEGRVAWSGELGYGVRPPEDGQHAEVPWSDVAPAAEEVDGDGDHGHGHGGHH